MSDKPALEYVFTPFTEGEREVLERFRYTAEKLLGWGIGTKDVKLTARRQLGVEDAGGPAWEIAMPELSEEELVAATALFRQLYDAGEPASVNRVCNILSQHAAERQTEAGNRTVEDLRGHRKSMKKLARESPYGRLLIEDNPHGRDDHLDPDTLFRLWFNGEVHHGDLDKRDVSEENTRVLYASALQGAIKSHLDLWSQLNRVVAAVLDDEALSGAT